MEAHSLVDIIDSEGNLASPLTIQVKMHSSQDEIRSNVTTNIKRDTIRFMRLPGLWLERRQPLAICGGGPSLDDNVEELKQFGHVMACGSVHDHLVDLGITPTFALAVDAKADAVNWFQKPQEKTSYLLASQCHPNMFEQLKGHKIAMWNFPGQLDDEQKFYNDEPMINWGCMVGVHSLQMAVFLGFQELHFFGMDGNHRDGKHHSYDVGSWSDEIMSIGRQFYTINGRTFMSTTALISQMQQFFDVFASPWGQYIKGYVHGDGLWAEVIKNSPPEMKEWLEAV